MRIFDWFALVVLRVAALLVSPFLIVCARTWRGRLVGVIGLSLCIPVGLMAFQVLFIIDHVANSPNTLRRTSPAVVQTILQLVVLGLGTIAGLFGPLAAMTFVSTLPNPRGDKPGIRSVFLGPTFLNRYQFALLNEEDWVWLGVQLATRLDWRVSREDAAEIRETVRETLNDIRHYSESWDLAAALPLALWGRVAQPDHGHYLLYRPEAEPGERLGLLVVLHGHGGNAVLLPYSLRALAQACRCVIVCPSFGFGNWEHPQSVVCVTRALDHALETTYGIDQQRVFLLGLSQGGAGVGRVGAALPDRFAGLVFFSPTMQPRVLKSAAFEEGWQGRSVLVIHGQGDRHVSMKSVKAGVTALKSIGVDVQVVLVPEASHFLFFSMTEEVTSKIGHYLTPQVAVSQPESLHFTISSQSMETA